MGVETSSTQQAVEILRQHANKIEQIMKLLTEFQLRSLPQDSTVRSWYDNQELAYSEMSVCAICNSEVVYKLVVPFGFVPNSNMVDIDSKFIEIPKSRPHTFYYNPHSTHVICLTAAQFICPDELPEYKGEKIARLVECAPGLTTRLNDEVVVLHGTLDDINEKLGFQYVPTD